MKHQQIILRDKKILLAEAEREPPPRQVLRLHEHQLARRVSAPLCISLTKDLRHRFLRSQPINDLCCKRESGSDELFAKLASAVCHFNVIALETFWSITTQCHDRRRTKMLLLFFQTLQWCLLLTHSKIVEQELHHWALTSRNSRIIARIIVGSKSLELGQPLQSHHAGFVSHTLSYSKSRLS